MQRGVARLFSEIRLGVIRRRAERGVCDAGVMVVTSC